MSRHAETTFEFEVDSVDAVAAFHHPYAYTHHEHGATPSPHERDDQRES